MTEKTDPPLVNVEVTNPVTYIKKWWAKIIGNEGVDFRIHFRPLTAIFIAIVIASMGFGVGRFVIPSSVPFFKYEELLPSTSPEPTPEWKETAYTGILQSSESTGKYFLVTGSSAEAITIKAPETIDLREMIGKRILAIGLYSKNERTLQVKDAKNLEILPKTPIPLPTSSTTPEAPSTPPASPSASPVSD